ncbi:hypothetical protein AB9E06_34060 [Rhizobium leguminosarum]|uniref:hypothetical protein n=1 Tax=Rhizobium leguminosarum TaxID=384 RepID=UPI003F991CD9
MKLNELGSEGETLPRRVGLWDLTETRWTKSGAEPATSSGLVADVGMCFEEGFDDRWRCRRTFDSRVLDLARQEEGVGTAFAYCHPSAVCIRKEDGMTI